MTSDLSPHMANAFYAYIVALNVPLNGLLNCLYRDCYCSVHRGAHNDWGGPCEIHKGGPYSVRTHIVSL